jgi:hypothetical protein
VAIVSDPSQPYAGGIIVVLVARYSAIAVHQGLLFYVLLCSLAPASTLQQQQANLQSRRSAAADAIVVETKMMVEAVRPIAIPVLLGLDLKHQENGS